MFTLENRSNGYLDKDQEYIMCHDIHDKFRQKCDKLAGINIANPVIEIEHADLRKIPGGESTFRRFCPVCIHGILMVKRNIITLALEAEDNCLLCGQRVKYKDVEQLKERCGEYARNSSS